MAVIVEYVRTARWNRLDPADYPASSAERTRAVTMVTNPARQRVPSQPLTHLSLRDQACAVLGSIAIRESSNKLS